MNIDFTKLQTTRKYISVEEFNRMPEHPRQRNTAYRARDALKGRLSKPSPAHEDVVICVFQGVYYKTDGNTRSYLWSRNLLAAPRRLSARIIWCNTKDELNALFEHFDNKEAVKKTHDQHYGLMRDLGLKPKSPLFQRPKFAVALVVAKAALEPATKSISELRKIKDEDLIAEFIDELTLLDGIGVKNASVWKAGVLAGALIALREHGTRVLPFFDDFNQNNGEKTKTSCDAVEALRNVSILQKPEGDDNGWAKGMNLAGKCLTCVERWLAKKRFKTRADGLVTVEAAPVAGRLHNNRKLAASVATIAPSAGLVAKL